MTVNTEELREKVAKKLEANPGIKTGMMADALGVTEADVLRAMPDGYATELSSKDYESIIREIESLEQIYFVTRNGACVTEIKGRFGGFSQSGPFFNVSGENIHLHLKLRNIGSVFHVTPPVPEGRPPMPSLQFFQDDGVMAFKVFLVKQFKEEAGEDFDGAVSVLEQLAKKFL